MVKFFRIADVFYLLLLGIGIGGIIACGAFAAPVVFKIESFLPHITQYESGMIMGRIFMRLNVYLQILFVVIACYEIISAILRQQYRKVWLIIGGINILCIALFVWYYTPFILNVENLASDNFSSMHAQSVWIFKILMFGLAIAFVWRAYSLRTES